MREALEQGILNQHPGDPFNIQKTYNPPPAESKGDKTTPYFNQYRQNWQDAHPKKR